MASEYDKKSLRPSFKSVIFFRLLVSVVMIIKLCWAGDCKSDIEKRYLDAQTQRSYSISRRHLRAVVLTHSWGGGTELFENELLLNRNFDFIFFRVKYEKSQMKIRGMLDSERTFYDSEWFEPTFQCIEDIFSSISYDLLLIDFILPIPQLIEFLQYVNVPMVYVMHDHHAINYDIERDMHVDCNITGNFFSTLNISSISKQYLDSSAQHRRDYESVLRRCFAVSTPSQRNKAIFRAFFPDIVVYTAPNRPAATTTTTISTTTTTTTTTTRASTSAGYLDNIRLVVLGALSVGKGSHVIQDVSNICSPSPSPRISNTHSIGCNFTIYHIGTAANYRRGVGEENHVISLGAYNTSEYLLTLIASVQPDYIWFPANRHESYCYMLDNVISSGGYPIIAADTGSFPERLFLRPNSYIGNGCMGAEAWAEFILQVHRSRNNNSNTNTPTTTTTTNTTTSLALWGDLKRVRYDFDSFAQFLQAVYLFQGAGRSHPVEDWKIFSSLIRKRKFIVGKKKFLKFIRKIKRDNKD